MRLPRVDRSIDPADNFPLVMAEAGRADYLASGDKRQVLALKHHGNTHIVTMRQPLAVPALDQLKLNRLPAPDCV